MMSEERTKQTPGQQWTETRRGGMTLRDYFAAKAMQGIISNGRLRRHFQYADTRREERVGGAAYVAARDAYQIADAMIAAREKDAAPTPERTTDE